MRLTKTLICCHGYVWLLFCLHSGQRKRFSYFLFCFSSLLVFFSLQISLINRQRNGFVDVEMAHILRIEIIFRLNVCKLDYNLLYKYIYKCDCITVSFHCLHFHTMWFVGLFGLQHIYISRNNCWFQLRRV